MSTRITLDGLPDMWQEVTTRYDYERDGARCPICGGVGFCWQGWFTCDSWCRARALLADGRMWLAAGARGPKDIPHG